MSLWFLLVCHALTQNDAESPVDMFLSTSQSDHKTHVLTKSLYIKTWFVCLNKFECWKRWNISSTKTWFMMSPSDLLATPVLNAFSERCSRYHHWDKNKTTLLRSMSNKIPSSEVTKWILRSSHNSFMHFCDDSAGKLKQNIWKVVWFLLLYKFKSSRCSPYNQSTQRRRKVYRWVSSSPIKYAKHETCKYDVNHHGWAHH